MLDYFKFRWGDAWYSYGYRYEAVLESSPIGERINWIIDGMLWDLVLGYSKSINIETAGINGFPDTFHVFMKKLHSEWNLPYSKIDSVSFSFKEYRKGTIVEEK